MTFYWTLLRCGHLHTLCDMLHIPVSLQGGRGDLRLLLYNLVTRLCDDMKRVFTTAYILTQEDSLGLIIRAMTIWLSVNERDYHFTTNMTKEKVDRMIEQIPRLPVPSTPLYTIRGGCHRTDSTIRKRT